MGEGDGGFGHVEELGEGFDEGGIGFTIDRFGGKAHFQGAILLPAHYSCGFGVGGDVNGESGQRREAYSKPGR